MQVLEVVLYNAAGQLRRVKFQPGALNVVTGVSATGKSALLHIVEFCLGRDSFTVPAGVISKTVEWYAVLLQLPGTRAFVARPRPREGKASTSRAMLELGAELQALPMNALTENTDTGALREQLGRLLGIGEYRYEPPLGSLRHPYEAGLGQASLLCFQGQGETANPGVLFHRQDEDGITQALRDTLPYFLGAVAADYAVRRLQLTNSRRDLRRAEDDLADAQRHSDSVDAQVQALIEEAYSSGLVDTRETQSRDEAIRLLREAVDRPPRLTLSDEDQAARRRELEAERLPLRQELREVADQRALLFEQAGSEQGYENAVEGQLTRLRAVELIPARRSGADAPDDAVCPLCGNELDEPDPTVDQLGDALTQLRRQLDGVRATRPRREAVLRELEKRAESARQRLRALEEALGELAAGDKPAVNASSQVEEQAFRRGRIDAILSRLRLTGATINQRELAVTQARRLVDELESLLAASTEREELAWRLSLIGAEMTSRASDLRLEHSSKAIRLDLNKLTVVADTDDGPVPLARFGSAENWVGYHLVAHLALHRYFVLQNRPVPHFLMLDQPTQAYYPSDREQETGEFEAETDRDAVRRLFMLMRNVVVELAPHFQVIVCDHANLDEEWFQDAVGLNNFRGGIKLIPESWLAHTDHEVD